jgi:hypothetical protein
VGFCLVLSGTGTILPDPEARIVVQRDVLTLVGEFRVILSGDKP